MFAGASLVFASAVLLLITSGKAIEIPVSSIGLELLCKYLNHFFFYLPPRKPFGLLLRLLVYFCAIFVQFQQIAFSMVKSFDKVRTSARRSVSISRFSLSTAVMK